MKPIQAVGLANCISTLIVVMLLGVLVDGLVFGALEGAVHRRRGLTGVQG